MRVEVWAKAYDRYNSAECIWSGNMSNVPREGEIIFIFDGWGGLRVQHVYWNMDEQSVELGVDDRNGEYRKEFNRIAQLTKEGEKHEETV